MRKILSALALTAGLFAGPAYADFTAKDASGATITFKNSGDCTAVVCVAQQQPVDSTGAAFGVVANPFIVGGASATGAALAGNPVRIGISDGTNAQNWLAAIALADGVNGNNTGAVAPWVWNGATWDRMPGTAANGIKAIVTNAGTFAVQSASTLAAETTKVIGTVRVLGNAGAIFDGATGAAVPANALYLGASVGGTLTGLVATSNGLKTDGSAVTQPVSVASGQIVDGGDATQGAKADSVCGTATGTCSLVALVKYLNSQVAAAVPAGTNLIGYTSADPCAQGTKTNVAISMQNTTTLKLVSLSSAKQIYICSLALVASGATVFSIADGTKVTTECDTAAEAVIGAAVAAHGLSLAANGGVTFGSGASTIARTTTAAHDLCLFQSGSVDLSGVLTYVQQ